MLSKKIALDVKQKYIRPRSIIIEHSFTDFLTISHNQEIEALYFGDSVQVFIKRHIVYYPDPSHQSIILCNLILF